MFTYLALSEWIEDLEQKQVKKTPNVSTMAVQHQHKTGCILVTIHLFKQK